MPAADRDVHAHWLLACVGSDSGQASFDCHPIAQWSQADLHLVAGMPSLPSTAVSRPGETLRLVRRPASAVVHAVEGAGTARPKRSTHADLALANASRTSVALPCIVYAAPLQRNPGTCAELPEKP